MRRLRGMMLVGVAAIGALALTVMAIQNPGSVPVVSSADQPCTKADCTETQKVAAKAECSATQQVAAKAQCDATEQVAGKAECAATEQVAAKAECDAPCDATAKVAATAAAGQCPVSAAMGCLPKIEHRVGDQVTPCADTAKKLASEGGQPIEFLVAGKAYATEQEAFAALVTETETFVAGFAEVGATCPATGKTKVAGKDFSCADSAGKYAGVAKAAMEKVAMTYAVGDEKTTCAVTAGKVAEAKGDKIQYLVGGEQTPCELTARLKLAQAKYKAAVQALAAADQAEQAASTKTGNTGA